MSPKKSPRPAPTPSAPTRQPRPHVLSGLEGVGPPDYVALRAGQRSFWPTDDPIGSGIGETLEGVFLGVKHETFNNKPRAYFVVKEDDTPWFVSANQYLVEAFEKSGAKVAQRVRVTYVGTEATGAPSPARTYTVEIVG